MRYALLLGLLGLFLIQATLGQNYEQQADARSSVAKNGEKSKIDKETKDQLQESDNDDKELAKQQEESEGSGDDSDEDTSVENVEEKSSEGPEEASSESDAEKEDNSDAQRRTEEGQINKKKGAKLPSYPTFYPGGYEGSYQGGPAQFNPAGFWQYPYPYVHPMYPQQQCDCKCNGDKDEDEEKEDKKEKGKKNRRKQMVPSHYYGPPSAGWGGFSPGHTGAGWGAPYWYKSYIPSSQKQASRRFGIEGADLASSYGFGNGYGAHSYGSDYGYIGGYGGAGHLGGYGGAGHYGGYAGAGHLGSHLGGGYAGDHVGYGWNEGYGYPGVHGYGGHGYGGHGYGGHGYAGYGSGDMVMGITHAIGRPYIPKHGIHRQPVAHHGLSHIDIKHGHAFFGHEMAYQHLPTAQGHIQIASSGHNIGMGGHNLGGMADKQDAAHGTAGDFVGGIHADLGEHPHAGNSLTGPDHHGQVGAHFANHMMDDAHADLNVQHPLTAQGDGELGLHGDMGDHFGAIFPQSGHVASHGRHGVATAHSGMSDHFGPLVESSYDDATDDLDVQESGHEATVDHNASTAAEPALEGHQKSGVSAQQKKAAKKLKHKAAKARALGSKNKNTAKKTKSQQLP